MRYGRYSPDPGPGDPGADHYRFRHGAYVTQMGEGWVIGFTPTYSGCRQRNI